GVVVASTSPREQQIVQLEPWVSIEEESFAPLWSGVLSTVQTASLNPVEQTVNPVASYPPQPVTIGTYKLRAMR
ncbi:hypothetical protein, partial [Microbulbifer sp.]|uniref:hypothetical protein n=1 Tax=Microbulbifer sp. TaxID=1908541 RepID=UPI002F95B44F